MHVLTWPPLKKQGPFATIDFNAHSIQLVESLFPTVQEQSFTDLWVRRDAYPADDDRWSFMKDDVFHLHENFLFDTIESTTSVLLVVWGKPGKLSLMKKYQLEGNSGETQLVGGIEISTPDAQIFS